MTRHCPRCELRFRSEAELKEHLALDHRVATDVLDRYRYPGSVSMQPLYEDPQERTGPRRHLVVANQTLGGHALVEEIRRRMEAGAAEFVVVVPATHSAVTLGRARSVAPEVEAGEATDEIGAAQASWRLRMALGRLEGIGADATGRVGPADPVEAVAEVVAREPVDEIILSTLPPGVSRWLDADVPERIHRTFRIPVVVVTAAAQERSTTA